MTKGKERESESERKRKNNDRYTHTQKDNHVDKCNAFTHIYFVI